MQELHVVKPHLVTGPVAGRTLVLSALAAASIMYISEIANIDLFRESLLAAPTARPCQSISMSPRVAPW